MAKGRSKNGKLMKYGIGAFVVIIAIAGFYMWKKKENGMAARARAWRAIARARRSRAFPAMNRFRSRRMIPMRLGVA